MVRLLMEQRLPPGSHRSTSVLRDHGVAAQNFDAYGALGAFSRDLLAEDPEVRLEAAEALGWLVDSRATSPLLRALLDAEWDVRLTAVQGLVLLCPLPDWAFEQLTGKVDDPEAVVREAVMTAVASNECVDALPLLARGIVDRNRTVALAAANGLKHLGRLGITSADVASSVAQKLTEESDPHVGYALYWALGWQGGKKSEPDRLAWRYSPAGDLAWRVIPDAP